MQENHVTPSVDSPRARVIEALIADKLGSWTSDAEWLRDIAEGGFRGFANLSDSELIQCVSDAELDRDPEIETLICQLAHASTPAYPPRVVCVVEGGVLQHVLADREVDVVVMDLDVESADDGVTVVPGAGGDDDDVAMLGAPHVEHDPARVQQLFNLCHGG